MTIEDRIERLERTNRRYRLMFTVFGVLAVCAVGISATQDDETPAVLRAKAIEVVDDEGNILVALKEYKGAGAIATWDNTGQLLLAVLSKIVDGKRAGVLTTLCEEKNLVELGATTSGNGMVTTFNDQGEKLVAIGGGKEGDGGHLAVYNKTGETVCTLTVDENCSGVVSAFDRDGKGRTLKP